MSVAILDFEKIIRDFEFLDEDKLETIRKFMDKGRRHKNYILGTNQHSESFLETYDVDAVVDDYIVDQKKWKGKSIIRSGNIEEGSVVVNCSMSISPVTADKLLNSLRMVRVIHYSDVCRFSSELPLPDFVSEARDDFRENRIAYTKVFSLLCDDVSRTVFNDLLAYRLTGDPSYMENYSVRFKDQYFESFLGNLVDAVFVDCGGFDGDTTQEFCRRYEFYKKVYLFEPSESNIVNAKKRLSGFRDVDIIQQGLSDSVGILRFNLNLGSASYISETGSSSINVTTLDDRVTEKVTFIKMDLEGWEIKALRGSIRHIKNDKPILAISVYHHISDLWKIPELILEINSSYNVYLRHYTEGWSETVMYFVPR